MTNVNYNIAALRGLPIDDKKYCEIEGLDESLAHTPEILIHFFEKEGRTNENERLVRELLAKKGQLSVMQNLDMKEY